METCMKTIKEIKMKMRRVFDKVFEKQSEESKNENEVVSIENSVNQESLPQSIESELLNADKDGNKTNYIELYNNDLERKIFFKVMELFHKLWYKEDIPKNCTCQIKRFAGIYPEFKFPISEVYDVKDGLDYQYVKDSLSRMLDYLITQDDNWTFIQAHLFQSVAADEDRKEIYIAGSNYFIEIFKVLDKFNMLDIKNQTFREPTLDGKKVILEIGEKRGYIQYKYSI